jgi:hypothetical protein
LWEKGWRVGAGQSSSGSFALERRADDSKNKQRRRTDNGEEQKQIPSLRYGMTNIEQTTARAKARANTEILAAPE